MRAKIKIVKLLLLAILIIVVSAIASFSYLKLISGGYMPRSSDAAEQTAEEKELYKYTNEETIRPAVEEFMRAQSTGYTRDIEMSRYSLAESEGGALLTAEAYVAVAIGSYRYFELEFTNEAKPKLISSKERRVCTFKNIKTPEEAEDLVYEKKGERAVEKTYLFNVDALRSDCQWSVETKSTVYLVHDSGKIEMMLQGTTTGM